MTLPGNLLAFTPSVLAKPTRGGQAVNLTKLFKNRAANFTGVSCIQAPFASQVMQSE